MAGEIELWRAGHLMAERMTRAVDAAAGELARTVSDVTGVLNRYTVDVERAEGDGRRALEGVVLEPRGMHGTDLYGKRIAIDPDRVVVRPLHNDHREVVGLRIPSNSDDDRAAVRWADGQLLGHFTTRVPVLPDADHKRASSLAEDWDSHPFFVVGKFNARDAEVMFERGDAGVEPVRLGGPELGHLIARSPEFDALTGTATGSQRPVVLVSHGSGVTDPKLVESIAGYLHGQTDLIGPVRGVAYPTTRLEPTRFENFLVYPELEARVTLDSSLQPTSEYLEYRHPLRPQG